jgi:hypothetical protein
MQIRTPVVFIVALTIGLAACGKRAEEPSAATQTAQTDTASKGTDAATAPGMTTNFEGQPAPAQPAPGK